MADIYPVHDFLATTLKNGLTPVGATFIDGKLPEGASIPVRGVSGAVVPHVVLDVADPDMHPRGQSIDGPRDALGLMYFELMIVSATAREVTRLRDVVTRLLVGVPVPDGGVIYSNGGLPDMTVTLVTPQRYMRTLMFWVSVGASGATAA